MKKFSIVATIALVLVALAASAMSVSQTAQAAPAAGPYLDGVFGCKSNTDGSSYVGLASSENDGILSTVPYFNPFQRISVNGYNKTTRDGFTAIRVSVLTIYLSCRAYTERGPVYYFHASMAGLSVQLINPTGAPMGVFHGKEDQGVSGEYSRNFKNGLDELALNTYVTIPGSYDAKSYTSGIYLGIGNGGTSAAKAAATGDRMLRGQLPSQ
ncbi:MAG: hypothetical protein M1450_02100 [Patescibacteria group bacterium]|nr:hypothetical protein [Patescibacteria group bacterium]